jgi:peptidoglycan/LPS O-acetylase OafA/YrhL
VSRPTRTGGRCAPETAPQSGGGSRTMLETPLSTRRSDGLDALRAIFAIWVLVSHAFPWAHQIIGNSPTIGFAAARWLAIVFQTHFETHPAVIGFIVLSGYCIHRNGFRRQRDDVPGYAVRRLLRIYPVYAAACLAGLVCCAVGRHYGRLLPDTIDPFCFGAKLSGVAAFDPRIYLCAQQGNWPLDTVAVELWLYAAYPLLLLGITRRFGEGTMWMLLLAAWCLGLAVTDTSLREWWFNASFVGFLPYWWIGVKFLDAEFVAVVRRYGVWLAGLWGVLTLVELAHTSELPLFLLEARKLVLALLIGLVIVRFEAAAPARTLRAFALIGRAGYSLYAFHMPILIILMIVGAPLWACLAATFAAGFVGYALIEKPAMEMQRTIAERRSQRPRPIGLN